MKKSSVILLVFLLWTQINYICGALEPTLLWKKNFNEKIDFVDLAEESGDVILVHGFAKDRITIWNKDGKTLWQWGPVLGKCIGWVQISDDGKIFAFHTQNTLEVKIKKGTHEDRVHVWSRENKITEISNFKDFSAFWLSRDGKFLFETQVSGYGGPVCLKDYKGNILWENKNLNLEETQIFYSADGNYILASLGYIYIFDLNEKKIISHLKVNEHVTSFSENGTYIGVKNKGILDRNGNILLNGDSTISGNGKIVVQQILGKLKVLRFPENVEIGEYSIKMKDWEIYPTIKLSYDGRICVVYGEKKAISPDANLFVIDTGEKMTFGIPSLKDKIHNFFITTDGKYLLIKTIYSIYYYKIL